MASPNVSVNEMGFLFLETSPVPGLESDDSGEVIFKDALVFDSKRVTDGSSMQENGLWERR